MRRALRFPGSSATGCALPPVSTQPGGSGLRRGRLSSRPGAGRGEPRHRAGAGEPAGHRLFAERPGTGGHRAGPLCGRVGAERREPGDFPGAGRPMEHCLVARSTCLRRGRPGSTRPRGPHVGRHGAMREEVGAPLLPSERPRYERQVTAVRAAIGDAAFSLAWQEGRAMTLERAIEYAQASSISTV